MDPFKILGIARTAIRQEVEAAYREKAMKYHPDRGGDAWAFEQVNWAYQEALRLLGVNESQRKEQGSKPPELKQPSPSPRPAGSYDRSSAGKDTNASTTPPPEVERSPAKRRKISRREWTSASLGTGILVACYIIFKIYNKFFRRDPSDQFRIER
jgi:DnaJ-like protein